MKNFICGMLMGVVVGGVVSVLAEKALEKQVELGNIKIELPNFDSLAGSLPATTKDKNEEK